MKPEFPAISLWEKETFFRKRDVVIIGGGFTGLWTALSVKERFPEKSVLVTERSAIPLGASTRNAGFACFGSLTEVLADSELLGWEKTLNLVKMRFDGLQKIQQFFGADEIDYEQCGGYELLKDRAVLKHLDEVNEKLSSITGVAETFVLNEQKKDIFGFAEAEYLIENPFEGALHSGKLLMNLIKRCQDQDIEFLFGTEITAVNEEDSQVIVTGTNFRVEAAQIIMCTNAFAKNLVPDAEVTPARGQILLTEPIENLKLKGTFHYDEGFYYFRNVENRILLGGGRNQDFKAEETLEMVTTDFLQNHLQYFLKTVILPGHTVRIDQRWSGIMAMGAEKFPVIKRLTNRQLLVARLSGMGVALAPVLGEKAADML